MQLFDTERIGQQIAAARRRKNMTQSALADQLGVSYQAVSNWERSQSLPDIDKYAQLAEALDLDLTTLLGSAKATVTVTRVMQDAPLDEETLAAAAPVMPPVQVAAKAAAVELSLESAVALAPFVSGGVLEQVIAQHQDDAELAQTLPKLAPFLSGEALAQLVETQVVPALPESFGLLKKLAPFMPKAAVTTLVETLLDQPFDEPVAYRQLFPFVDRDQLAEWVAARPADQALLKAALPFLAHEAVAAQFTAMAERDPEDPQLRQMAPFVDKATLAAHIQRLSAAALPVRAFLPFLDEATLTDLFRA